MKAAILILAHHQPAHLARLITYLSCEWTRIFIHIDKKADLSLFKNSCTADNNPVFLEYDQRVKVSWGGFSTVEATLNLLRASRRCDEQFDRFCLLSGSDFPIKSLDEIRHVFDSEKEFMRVDRRLDPSASVSHWENVQYHHVIDDPPSESPAPPLRKREVYDAFPLFHGSTWWALTAGCVNHMTAFLHNNRQYLDFHRHTRCADEIVFHSLVKNSSYAENLTHDFERAEDLHQYFANNEHGCHYIDWNAKGSPLPKILDESDLKRLLLSEALFARKFSEDASATVLEMLTETFG